MAFRSAAWIRFRRVIVLAAACCLFPQIACVRNDPGPNPQTAPPPPPPTTKPANPDKWADLFLPSTTPPLFEHSKLFNNNYALVIGVGRYAKPQWNSLHNASGDAWSIGVLLAQQGFYVRLLRDEQATKGEIVKTLGALETLARQGDRVVVFFAGHGYTEGDPGSETGYVVPFDGDGTSTMISMDEIYELSARIKSPQQILWLMDACYSGLAVTRGGAENPLSPEYIEQLARRPARQVITAGGKDQQVTDSGPNGHSYFAGAILNGLQLALADLNRDQYVTCSELVAYLQSCGSNQFQTPGHGTLPGHQGGDFIFDVGPRKQVAGSPGTCWAPPKSKNACDRNGDGIVDRIDVNIAVGQALGTIPCSGSTLKDGACNVVDVQRVVNAALGQACRVD